MSPMPGGCHRRTRSKEAGVLILHLGLPTRIRDTGVSQTVMAAVAEAALHDPLLASNPRPIKSLTEVWLLLEQAW